MTANARLDLKLKLYEDSITDSDVPTAVTGESVGRLFLAECRAVRGANQIGASLRTRVI